MTLLYRSEIRRTIGVCAVPESWETHNLSLDIEFACRCILVSFSYGIGSLLLQSKEDPLTS